MLFIGAPPLPGAEPLAKVTILAFDEAGSPVDVSVLSFKDHDRELAPRFQRLEASDIPYGEYRYDVERRLPGVRQVAFGTVSVSSLQRLLVVSLQEFPEGVSRDMTTPYGFAIRGKIDLTGAEKGLYWVRLSPIYKNELVDLPVNTAGEFSIFKPLQGRYLLTVMKGGDVITVQHVSFEQGFQPAEFRVPIAGARPATIRVGDR